VPENAAVPSPPISNSTKASAYHGDRAIAARPIRNSSDPRSRAREAEFCLGLLEYARISPKQRDKLDVTCARLKSAKIKSRTDLLGKYRHRRRKRPTRY